MGIALTIGTLILVFAAYGYDIDRKTGDVIQNGLIIVDAHPESAAIYVNGQEHGNTNNRLVLPAGQYNVELKRDGYRSWSHVVNLSGSSIEQLAYPFLFPSKLVTKTLQTFSSVPSLATESPDRHWLIVQVSGSVNTFNETDLGNNKHPVTTITLPSDTFTTAPGAHTYEAIEWSTDNTHLLLKHSFASGSEFIMLDRDAPANSLNLNKVFTGKTFTTLSLRDKKADQFYMFDAASGALSIADSKTKIVTALLNKVVSYKPYKADAVLYTTMPTDPASTIAEVHMHTGAKDHLLRTVPKSDVYLLEMAEFNSHTYVVAGSKTEGKAYLYRDPADDFNRTPAHTPQPFRVLVIPGAYNVSFSTIARFIMIENGSHFAVYDAETGRQFRYDTKLTAHPNQKATWMDGHRLLVVSDGKVAVFDFDGSNIQTLEKSMAAYTPFFDRDYTALFTLSADSSAPDKTNLQRTELKVLPTNQ